MNKQLVVATSNKGKMKELREILAPLGFVLYSKSDLNISIDPEETGLTYRDNALIKAKAMAELVDWPVIADDSGIEIEALGEHFPGVHTARFAKSLSEDYSIVLMKILAMMKGVSNRKASYHCCICYYDKKVGKPLFFEGVCEGSILEEVKGNNGFGYDPIFHYDKGNLDFGLASEEEKNKVSHRAMALKKLAVYLSI